MAISSNQIDVMNLGSLDVSPESVDSTVSMPSASPTAVKIPSVHPSSTKASKKAEEDYLKPFEDLKKAKARQAQEDVYKTYIEALQERNDALAQTKETKEEKADIKAAENYYKDRLKPLSISEIDRQERDSQLLEEYNAKIANNPEQKDMLLGELAQKREAIIQERQLEEQGLAPWKEININPLDPYAQTFSKEDQKALSSYYTRQEQAEKIRPLINSKVLDRNNYTKMTVTMDDLDSGVMKSGLFGGAQGFRLASTDRLGRQLPMLDGIDAYEVAVQHATKFATQAPLVRAILGKADNEAISKQEWDNTKIYSMYIALKAYHGDNTPEAYNPTKIQQYQDYIEQNKTFDIYVKELDDGRPDAYGRKIVDFMTENFESPVAKFTYDPMLNASFNMSKTADYIETTRRISDAQYAVLKAYRERVQAYEKAKDDKNSYPVELIDIFQARGAQMLGQAISLSDTMEEFISNYIMNKGAGAFREFVNNRYKMNMEFGVNSIKYDEYQQDMLEAKDAWDNGNYLKLTGIVGSNLPIILTESAPDMIAGLTISAALASTGIGLGIAPEVMSSFGSLAIRSLLANAVISAAAQTAQDIQEFKELHKRDMTREEAVRAFIANDFAYALDTVLGGGMLGRVFRGTAGKVLATPRQIIARSAQRAVGSVFEEAFSEFGQEYIQNAISQANVKGTGDNWYGALKTELEDFRTHGFEGFIGFMAAGAMSTATQPFALKGVIGALDQYRKFEDAYSNLNIDGKGFNGKLTPGNDRTADYFSKEEIEESSRIKDDIQGTIHLYQEYIDTNGQSGTALSLVEIMENLPLQLEDNRSKLTGKHYKETEAAIRRLQEHTFGHFFDIAVKTNDNVKRDQLIKAVATTLMPNIDQNMTVYGTGTNTMIHKLIDYFEEEIAGSAPFVKFVVEQKAKDPNSVPDELDKLGDDLYAYKDETEFLLKLMQSVDPNANRNTLIQAIKDHKKTMEEVHEEFLKNSFLGHSVYQVSKRGYMLKTLIDKERTDLDALLQTVQNIPFIYNGNTLPVQTADAAIRYYLDSDTQADFKKWLEQVETRHPNVSNSLVHLINLSTQQAEVVATLERLSIGHVSKISQIMETALANPLADKFEMTYTSWGTGTPLPHVINRGQILIANSKTNQLYQTMFEEAEAGIERLQEFVDSNPSYGDIEKIKEYIAEATEKLEKAKRNFELYKQKARLAALGALDGEQQVLRIVRSELNSVVGTIIGTKYNIIDTEREKIGMAYFYGEDESIYGVSTKEAATNRSKHAKDITLPSKSSKLTSKDRTNIVNFITSHESNKQNEGLLMVNKTKSVFDFIRSTKDTYLSGNANNNPADFWKNLADGNSTNKHDLNWYRNEEQNPFDRTRRSFQDVRLIYYAMNQKQREEFLKKLGNVVAQGQILRDNHTINDNPEPDLREDYPTDVALYNNIYKIYHILTEDKYIKNHPEKAFGKAVAAPDTVREQATKVTKVINDLITPVNTSPTTDKSAEERSSAIHFLLEQKVKEGLVKKIETGNIVRYIVPRSVIENLNETVVVYQKTKNARTTIETDSSSTTATMLRGVMRLEKINGDKDSFVFRLATDTDNVNDILYVETRPKDTLEAGADTSIHKMCSDDRYSINNDGFKVTFTKKDGTEIKLQFKEALWFMIHFNDGSTSADLIEKIDPKKLSDNDTERDSYLSGLYDEFAHDKEKDGFVINGDYISKEDLSEHPTLAFDYAYLKALKDNSIDLTQDLKGITEIFTSNNSNSLNVTEAEYVARALAIQQNGIPINTVEDLKKTYGVEEEGKADVGDTSTFSGEKKVLFDKRYISEDSQVIMADDVEDVRRAVIEEVNGYVLPAQVGITYRGINLSTITQLLNQMTEEELITFLGDLRKISRPTETYLLLLQSAQGTGVSPEALRTYNEVLDKILNIDVLGKYLDRYHLGLREDPMQKYIQENDTSLLNHTYEKVPNAMEKALEKFIQQGTKSPLLQEILTIISVLNGKNFKQKGKEAVDINYEHYIKGYYWNQLQNYYHSGVLRGNKDLEFVEKMLKKSYFETTEQTNTQTFTDSNGDRFEATDLIGQTQSIQGSNQQIKIEYEMDLDALKSLGYKVEVLSTTTNTNSPYKSALNQIIAYDEANNTVYVSEFTNDYPQNTKQSTVVYKVIEQQLKSNSIWDDTNTSRRTGYSKELFTLKEALQNIQDNRTMPANKKILAYVQIMYAFGVHTTEIQSILNNPSITSSNLEFELNDIQGKKLKDLIENYDQSKPSFKPYVNTYGTQLEVNGENVPFSDLAKKVKDNPQLGDLIVDEASLAVKVMFKNADGTTVGAISNYANVMKFNTQNVKGLTVAVRTKAQYTLDSNLDKLTTKLNHERTGIATLAIGDGFAEQLSNPETYEEKFTPELDEEDTNELIKVLYDNVRPKQDIKKIAATLSVRMIKGKYYIKKKGKLKQISDKLGKKYKIKEREQKKVNNALVDNVCNYVASFQNWWIQNGGQRIRIVLNTTNKLAFGLLLQALNDKYGNNGSVELIFGSNGKEFDDKDTFLKNTLAEANISVEDAKKSKRVMRTLRGIYGDTTDPSQIADVIVSLGKGVDPYLASTFGDTVSLRGNLNSGLTKNQTTAFQEEFQQAIENKDLDEELTDENYEPFQAIDVSDENKILMDNTDAFMEELKGWQPNNADTYFDTMMNPDSDLSEGINTLTNRNTVDLASYYTERTNLKEAIKNELKGNSLDTAVVVDALKKASNSVGANGEETTLENNLIQYLVDSHRDNIRIIEALQEIDPSITTKGIIKELTQNEEKGENGTITKVRAEVYNVYKFIAIEVLNASNDPRYNVGMHVVYYDTDTHTTKGRSLINKDQLDFHEDATDNDAASIATFQENYKAQLTVLHLINRNIKNKDKDVFSVDIKHLTNAIITDTNNKDLMTYISEKEKAGSSKGIEQIIEEVLDEYYNKASEQAKYERQNPQMKEADPDKIAQAKPSNSASIYDKISYEVQYSKAGGTEPTAVFSHNQLNNELAQERQKVEATGKPTEMAKFNSTLALWKTLDSSTAVAAFNISKDRVNKIPEAQEIQENIEHQVEASKKGKKHVDKDLATLQQEIENARTADDSQAEEEAWYKYFNTISGGISFVNSAAQASVDALNTIVQGISPEKRILKEGVIAEATIIKGLQDNGMASVFFNQPIDTILSSLPEETKEKIKELIDSEVKRQSITLNASTAHEVMGGESSLFKLYSTQLANRYLKREGLLEDERGNPITPDLGKMSQEELAQILVALINSDPSFLLVYNVSVSDNKDIKLEMRKEVVAAMIAASYDTMQMFNSVSKMSAEELGRFLNQDVSKYSTRAQADMINFVHQKGNSKVNVTRQLGNAIMDSLSIRYTTNANDPSAPAFGGSIIANLLGNIGLDILRHNRLVKEEVVDIDTLKKHHFTADHKQSFVKFHRDKNPAFMSYGKALSEQIFDSRDDLKDIFSFNHPIDNKHKLAKGSDFRPNIPLIDPTTRQVVKDSNGRIVYASQLSTEAENFLDTMNHTPYVLTNDQLNVIKDIVEHQTEVALALGLKDENELNEMTEEERTSAEGENRSILQSVKSIVALYNQIVEERQKSPNSAIPTIYFNWEQIVSGRYQIKGSLFNVQTNKLMRTILIPEACSGVDFDGSNQQDLHDEIFGLAQSFDIMSFEGREGIKKLLEDCKVEAERGHNLGIDIYQTALYCSEDDFKAAWIKYGLGVEERGLIIQAAEHLVLRCNAMITQFKRIGHIDIDSLRFQTSLMVEDDSTTSGYFLNIASFPEPKLIGKYAIKVGIDTDLYDYISTALGMNFNTADVDEIDLMKKMEGFYDIYKQGAIGAQEVLNKRYNGKTYLEQAITEVIDDDEFLKTRLCGKVNPGILAKIIGSSGFLNQYSFIASLPHATLDSNGVYKVDSKFRELLKPIIMIFGYAAGHDTIVRQLGETFYEQQLEGLKDIISKNEDEILNYIKNIDEDELKAKAPIANIFAYNLCLSTVDSGTLSSDKIPNDVSSYKGIELTNEQNKKFLGPGESYDMLIKEKKSDEIKQRAKNFFKEHVLISQEEEEQLKNKLDNYDNKYKDYFVNLMKFKKFYQTAVRGFGNGEYTEEVTGIGGTTFKRNRDTTFNLSDIQVKVSEINNRTKTVSYNEVISNLLAETYGEAVYEALKDFAPLEEKNNAYNSMSNIETQLFSMKFNAELDAMLEELNPVLKTIDSDGDEKTRENWNIQRGIALRSMTMQDYNRLKQRLVDKHLFPTMPNIASMIFQGSTADKQIQANIQTAANLLTGIQVLVSDNTNVYMDALLNKLQSDTKSINLTSFDIMGRMQTVGSAGLRTAVSSTHSFDGSTLVWTILDTAKAFNKDYQQSIATAIHDALYTSFKFQNKIGRAYNYRAAYFAKNYKQLKVAYDWFKDFISNCGLVDAAIANGQKVKVEEVIKDLDKYSPLSRTAKKHLQALRNGLKVDKDGYVQGTKLSALEMPEISRNTFIDMFGLRNMANIDEVSTKTLYSQITVADVLKKIYELQDRYYNEDYGYHTLFWRHNFKSVNNLAGTGRVDTINTPNTGEIRGSSKKTLSENYWNTQRLLEAADNNKLGVLKLLETIGQQDNPEEVQRLYSLLDSFMDMDTLDAWVVTQQSIAGNSRGATHFGNKEIILQRQSPEHTIAGFSQTNSEIYAHELIHALFNFAFSSNDTKTRECITKLRALRDYVIKKKLITEDDFYDDTGITSEQAKKEAKEYYNYIFNEANHDDAGLKEFLSYVLTNEKVFGKLRNVKIKSDNQNKKSLFGVILDTVTRLFKVAFGKMKLDQAVEELNDYMTGTTLEEDATIYEYAVKLCMDIKKANSRAGTLLEKAKSMTSTVTDTVNAIRDCGNEFVAPMLKKLSDFPDLALQLAHGTKAEILAKMLVLAPFNKDVRKGLHDYFGYMGKELTSGWLTDIIEDLKSSDEYSFDFGKFDRRATAIDNFYKKLETFHNQRFREVFKTNSKGEELSELTLADEDALEVLVRGNLFNWLNAAQDNVGDIQRMLIDKTYRNNYKKNILTKSLPEYWVMSKDKTATLSTETQKSLMQLIENLANFEAAIMVNAKGTTFFSSYDNAKTLLMKHRTAIIDLVSKDTKTKKMDYDEKLENLLASKIDRLASLIYLDKMSGIANDKLERCAALSDNGLTYFLGAHKLYHTDANNTINLVERSKERGVCPIAMKFHCVEDIVFKPLADRATMEHNGYRLLNENLLVNNSDDVANYRNMTSRGDYGVYLRDLTIKQRTDGTILSLQGIRDNSLSIDRMLSDSFVLSTEAETAIRQEALLNGLKDGTEAYTHTADRLAFATKKHSFEDVVRSKSDKLFESMLTSRGTYDGFENMILSSQYDGNQFRPYTYKDAVAYMNMDTNGINLLSNMLATQEVINESHQANTAIIELLNGYFKENKVYHSTGDYYLDKNNGMKFIDVKEELIKNFGTAITGLFKTQKLDHFYVREDLAKSILGVKSFSITNWTNEKGENYIPPQFRAAAVYGEKLCRMLGYKSKENTVVRTPKVLVGNIFSNMNIHALTESNWGKIVKMYIANTQATYKYLKERKEAIALKFELKALNQKKETEETQKQKEDLEQKINLLESSMHNSVVAPLMENDMFTNIVEDLSSLDQEDISDITEKIANNTYVKNTPKVVKGIFANLYMLRGTLLFDIMSHVNQMADFIARVTEYQLLMAKFKGKKDSAEYQKYEHDTLNWVWDAFINYHKPVHRIEGYFNDMGFMKFTKYTRGIQKVILKVATTNPIGALMQFGRQFALKQAGLPEPESIFSSNIFSKSYGNMLSNPVENAENVLMPGLGHFFGMYKE